MADTTVLNRPSNDAAVGDDIASLERRLRVAETGFAKERERLLTTQRQVVELRRRLRWSEEAANGDRAAAPPLMEEVRRLTEENLALRQQLDAISAQFAELYDVKINWYEPELLRLEAELHAAHVWGDELYDTRKAFHEPEIERQAAEIERLNTAMAPYRRPFLQRVFRRLTGRS